MHVAGRQERTWRVPRPMLEDQLILAALVWAGAAVFTFLVIYVVSLFHDISVSGWQIVSSIAPWYIGFISGWMTFVQVPMFIAHGRTRRDSFIEWSITVMSLTVWAAVLMAIGYLIERLVYGLAGWPLEIDDDHLFSSHTDVGMVFLEYLLVFLVWVAVGGFVGASVYRSQDWGWLTLLPGSVLLGLSGSFDRSELGIFGFITRELPALDVSTMSGAIIVSLICAAIAFMCAWFAIRDLPLRNR